MGCCVSVRLFSFHSGFGFTAACLKREIHSCSPDNGKRHFPLPWTNYGEQLWRRYTHSSRQNVSADDNSSPKTGGVDNRSTTSLIPASGRSQPLLWRILILVSACPCCCGPDLESGIWSLP
jgi:hypothetical protein